MLLLVDFDKNRLGIREAHNKIGSVCGGCRVHLNGCIEHGLEVSPGFAQVGHDGIDDRFFVKPVDRSAALLVASLA
jgi:hypothetical protein